jgi:hypothetical protein
MTEQISITSIKVPACTVGIIVVRLKETISNGTSYVEHVIESLKLVLTSPLKIF